MVGELTLGPGILLRAGCLAWLQMGQCFGVGAVAWLSVGLDWWPDVVGALGLPLSGRCGGWRSWGMSCGRGGCGKESSGEDFGG